MNNAQHRTLSHTVLKLACSLFSWCNIWHVARCSLWEGWTRETGGTQTNRVLKKPSVAKSGHWAGTWSQRYRQDMLVSAAPSPALSLTLPSPGSETQALQALGKRHPRGLIRVLDWRVSWHWQCARTGRPSVWTADSLRTAFLRRRRLGHTTGGGTCAFLNVCFQKTNITTETGVLYQSVQKEVTICSLTSMVTV